MQLLQHVLFTHLAASHTQSGTSPGGVTQPTKTLPWQQSCQLTCSHALHLIESHTSSEQKYKAECLTHWGPDFTINPAPPAKVD